MLCHNRGRCIGVRLAYTYIYWRKFTIIVQYILLYLINIHWLSVDFDWSREGHAEGAILSCRMIILPSDVMSALKSAGALVVTCVCLQCAWRVLFCHVARSYYPLTSYPPKCGCTCSHMRLSCGIIIIIMWLRPRAILPASGEQIVMSPSLKGNNCIIYVHIVYRFQCMKINFITQQTFDVGWTSDRRQTPTS